MSYTSPANLSTTAPGQVPATVDAWFNDTLLSRAYRDLIHMLPCQRSTQPEGTSASERWRRVLNLIPATTPLVEGVPPNGSQLSVTDITCQKKQYGDYLTVSDMVTYIVKSPTLNYNVGLLAQQMAETMDEVVRNTMNSTASVYTCTNGTNGAQVSGSAMTELSTLDIRKCVRQLKSASGKTFTPIINATNRVGTAPIRPSYWALSHTDLMIDLESLPEFRQSACYANQQGVLTSEFGQLSGARFLLSQLGQMTPATTGASGNPAQYSTFFLAQDAVGVSQINKGNVSHIFNPAGPGVGGPLRQWSEQGWKSLFAACILNPSWIIKCRSTNKY